MISDMDSSSWEGDYRALRLEVGAAWVLRDVVRVSGPAGVAYLQAQLDLGAQARDGLALAADWPGLTGVDLVGEDPAVPDGVPLCDPAALEAVRVEAGIPKMGSELTERTIPAETGLVERAVSFTKG